MDKLTEGLVALKRIAIANSMDGIPFIAIREIGILRSLDHPNVVKLLDVARYC